MPPLPELYRQLRCYTPLLSSAYLCNSTAGKWNSVLHTQLFVPHFEQLKEVRSLQKPDSGPLLTKDEAPALSRPSYTGEILAVQLAVKRRDGKEAYRAFQDLQSIHGQHVPDSVLCNSLLQVLSTAQSALPSWKVYQALKGADLRYSTLQAVMVAAIRAHDPYRALEVFQDIQQRGMKPNIVTWCGLISAFTKTRRKGWPTAETAYDLWQQLRQQEDTVLDDASAYATGIMACSGAGKMQEARELLDEMREVGFRPDVRAYNMLLKGHARQDDIDSLADVVEDIREAGLMPDTTTYNTLVDAYVSAGLLNKAQQTLEEAKRRGCVLDVWAFSCLIKGHVRHDNLDAAQGVLTEMQQAGVAPNVVTYTTLLDGCVRVGDMARAERVLQDMTSQGIPANVITYNTLLRGYAAAGGTKAVKQVLTRMDQAGVPPREDTFNTIMEACLQRGDPVLVPPLFRQLQDLDLRPDSVSYTALITALSRLSHPTGAVEVSGRMEKDNRVDVFALNALVSALAMAGRMEEAERNLKRAVDLARRRGEPPPIEAFGAVMKGYAIQRNVDAVFDVLQEFRLKGGVPDDIMLDIAVNVCVRNKQYKRAMQFVRAMEREGQIMDKARIKRELEGVLRQKELSMRRGRGKGGGANAHRNLNLERLKFWLGLPNHYYDESSSDSEDEEILWDQEASQEGLR